MKKVFSHLVIPFTDVHFSTLRVDENVNAGFFRIGRIALKTKINNCCMIVAEIIEHVFPKYEIDLVAADIAKELKEKIAHFEEGLYCPAEFLNEIQYLADEAHEEAEDSHCRARLTSCDKFGCPAKKTPGSEKETEKMEKFLSDYDRK